MKNIWISILIILLSIGMTESYGQVPINTIINDIEYLKFELNDGLGNTKQPIANGSYYLLLDDEIHELTLGSRIQLNHRQVRYQSVDARSIDLFWLLFEFRDDHNVCFILCKRTAGKYIVSDKIFTKAIAGIRRNGIFISCEFEQEEDDQVFALYTFEGNIAEPQYFNQIQKAWKADIQTGKISEVEADKVRCLNSYYWDYMHDDETIPKWYYSGIVGVINDPDGYTNVRSRPNSNSKIVYRIEEGVEFKFWRDENYDWWKVHLRPDGEKTLINGFMHKSRIIEK
ncbi:SH3 domain-containing protein [Reichenbachiella ulvae]|uniref:SH3 domain-containing protein n=1 Tax=Reichenbachiella ulvae TaxID=2980104 RepID=A0ABT3CQR5_9BACT|nr:SH3 domain-containing protein [Reichenbachiella ulvae]MCV9385815.1 SH3 domain-containing protein [Reichenbachiella ulvae]